MRPPEGDRAAHYEKSQSTIKKNSDAIRQLRQDNKRLYKKLAEANTVSLSKWVRVYSLFFLYSDPFAVLFPRGMKVSSERPLVTEARRERPTATCQGR